MLIITNIDIFRYEIQALVKAFYPEGSVRVVVEGQEHAIKALEEEPEVFMRVNFAPEAITLTMGEGSPFQGKIRTIPARGGAAYNTTAQEAKDDIKSMLYEFLKELTGRKMPWGDLIGIRPTKLAMNRLNEGETTQEAADWLMREHQVSREKAELAADIADRERRILRDIHYENGYSLYIGIPFCPTTCLYCSFPSFNVALWQDRVEAYLDALDQEMADTAHLMDGQILDTVYIGGGTPTTLSADQLDRLMTCVEKHFDVSHLQEFTVEAGRPDSITEDKLKALARHHVTRISINPQTMNEETLRIIGRHHSVQQVIDTFQLARKCGFDNINMDIILGLPGENADSVRTTVEEIAKLSPDSLTVHSLAIKRASRLRQIIDEKGYPVLENTDETVAIAAEAASRMDMKPYYLYRQKNMSGNFENTGYAREGKYGIYNILIMEEKQSILALGAGSISKVVRRDAASGRTIQRSENPKDVATYIADVAKLVERKRRLYE